MTECALLRFPDQFFPVRSLGLKLSHLGIYGFLEIYGLLLPKTNRGREPIQFSRHFLLGYPALFFLALLFRFRVLQFNGDPFVSVSRIMSLSHFVAPPLHGRTETPLKYPWPSSRWSILRSISLSARFR